MHPENHSSEPMTPAENAQPSAERELPEQAMGQTAEGPFEITKIAEIQRMNIDQLNQFGKRIGLKHLGSLTKSQMVFEIVKAISEKPNEVLYGEGVLEILPDGFGFLRSPNYNYLS